MNIENFSNEEIAIKIKQGNNELTAVLWDRVNKLMFKILRFRLNIITLPTYIDKEDLKQELYFAMLTAVKNYNPAKPFKFSTYLNFSVMNMLDRDITSKSQREIKEHSYNICVGDEEDTELIELLEDTESTDFVYDYEQVEMERTLLNSIDKLPIKQNKAITEYYLHRKTYKNIADEWGCTLVNVRQFVAKGLRSLRRDKNLRAFYYCDYLPKLNTNSTIEGKLYTLWTSSEERKKVLRLMQELKEQGYNPIYTMEIYENAQNDFYKQNRTSDNVYIACRLSPKLYQAKHL